MKYMKDWEMIKTVSSAQEEFHNKIKNKIKNNIILKISKKIPSKKVVKMLLN